MSKLFDTSNEVRFNRNGMFHTTPKGFVVMDTFNNDFYPITEVDVDTKKSQYAKIVQQYRSEYSLIGNNLFLPYHYLVEQIGVDLAVFNTRPVNYRPLIPEYEEYITIAILGSTDASIINPRIYKHIGAVISSIMNIHCWRVGQDIIYHNLGSQFNETLLENHIFR